MNRTRSTSSLTPKTAHRQFFQWAVKWFYNNNITENVSKEPDIPSIICLLQAVGFKLREFEKSEDQLNSINDPLQPDNVRITLECGTSKMVAILELDEVSCECPNKNEVKDSSSWSITGTGPMTSSLKNVSKIEESGNNLLPEMSKETTRVIHDVAYKLFNMINNKKATNVNQNNTDSDVNTSKESLRRSYTDYFNKNFKPLISSKMTSNLINAKFSLSQSVIRDTKKDMTIDALKKVKLNRQETYEIDDNKSINKNKKLNRQETYEINGNENINKPSTPQQLKTSLGQLSVQSDEEFVSLIDYVVNAHQILDKAVNFILKKLPPSNSNSQILISVDEKEFMKPTLTSNSISLSSSCSSSGISSGSSSRLGSACSNSSTINQLTTVRSNPTIQKPQARRTTGLTQSSANKTTRNVSGITRRRCTISGASRVVPRSPLTTPRLPVSGSTSTTTPRTASSVSTTQQRPGFTQPSLNKISGNDTENTKRRNTTGGVSGIAQRTTQITPRLPLNSGGTAVSACISKFGYSAAKK